ncbi:MAG: radical SAM/SPASM domain-containing protein [Angelakisella sp.]
MALKRVYIEIINRCNLQCSFCPPSGRPARTMTADEFEQLAIALSGVTKYIYLHVKGEPLAHPQLQEILAIAHRQGLFVNLTTNGVLLPKQAELLLQSDAMRQTNLSVHGYTPQTHGELAQWMSALCDYAKKAAAKGRYTVFRFWTLPENRQPEGDDARAIHILEQEFPEAGSIAQQATGRAMTLAKGIFASFDEQFDWPHMDGPELGSEGICYGGRTMIGILADGTVVPCCLDGEGACSLGNAFTQPLSEILASPRYTALAKGFTNRHVVEPLCKRCGYRLKFN